MYHIHSSSSICVKLGYICCIKDRVFKYLFDFLSDNLDSIRITLNLCRGEYF